MAEEKKMQHIDSLPLADAVLCCNCEVISKRRQDARCAVCASGSIIAVSRMIEATAEAAQAFIEAAGRA